MIGRGARERGEYSIGEKLIPTEVNENPVQPFKSGSGSPVGPSEAPISQGEFNEVHRINAVVESISVRDAKVVIVFFIGIPYHVEIPTDEVMIQGVLAGGAMDWNSSRKARRSSWVEGA